MRKWTIALSLGVVAVLACLQRDEMNSCNTDGSLTHPSDADLPPEPTIPDVCANSVLEARHALRSSGNTDTDGLPLYDPNVPADYDTQTIQAAIDSCASSLAAGQKGSVKLQVNSSDPTRVAFVSAPLYLKAGVTLWIDKGVTLFASQNPRHYDAKGAGTCGTDANNTSSGCFSLINVNGTKTSLLTGAGVMGEGVIDGLDGFWLVFPGNNS